MSELFMIERILINIINRKQKTLYNMLKNKSGVENEKDKCSLRFDNKDKASTLQKQLSSVFTREPDGEVPNIPDSTDSFILDMHITEGMVIKKQQKRNAN